MNVSITYCFNPFFIGLDEEIPSIQNIDLSWGDTSCTIFLFAKGCYDNAADPPKQISASKLEGTEAHDRLGTCQFRG